jgi:NAD(P)-dependent dehydrogenase (short-subunit alcohol dehydrogenase family)
VAQPPVQVTVPVQPVAVQPAPTPQPAVAAQVPPPQPKPEPAPAASSGGEALTRKKLEDMLLTIVEERTGYPRDMVGMEQNLEADLGIDSIKRIEVVGAILQQLPAAHREALTDSRSKLNTQPTLKGMVELIAQAQVGGGVAVPFEHAGATHPDVAVAGNVLSSRLVMRPVAEPVAAIVPTATAGLTPGRFVILRDDHDATADDSDNVAAALAAELRARGVDDIAWIEAGHRRDEASLVERCAALSDAPIAGVLHLAALRAPALPFDADAAAWRAALWANEQSFFVALRALLPRLVDGAHVVAASDLGGRWGRAGSATPDLRCVGGSVGALKSLAEERPSLRVKAVDLDPSRSAAEQARDLAAEIALDGGRQEVGWPRGERTIFVSTPQDAPGAAAGASDEGPRVVLATGGARGITAEVLRTLARPGCTLVLTGRSAWPEEEGADTAALADAAALRAFHVARVREGKAKLTPGEIQRLVQATLAQREMRANAADFRAAGAAVEYHAVDVTDEAALRSVVDGVVARYGAIHGVVHGAGVIEDKLVADKASASWSRVVETKVIGLALLAKLVDPAALRFFTVFASVAGRYGNSGQADYATANELMTRIAQQLQARWGSRVAVSSMCWGPWGATTFGAGMVTAETEAKFAAKGVKLVGAALGRRLFRAEIDRAGGEAEGAVEVICGEADWDSHEARRAQVRWLVGAPTAPAASRPAAASPARDLAPLLGASTPTSLPTGERLLPIRLDPARDRYLLEHVIDGKMVLPAAAALEIMAEATQVLWPGWQVVEVREHRLLKGLEMTAAQNLVVRIAPPPYGSSEGFEVNASLQSPLADGRGLTHYRCVVRLEQVMPQPLPAMEAAPRHDERSLSVAKAYGEWLFHGPRFQVITSIDGLSPQGATARVRRSEPSQWLARGATPSPDAWCFDPALIDAAAQMAWLWSRAYRDESALPARFARVARCATTLPESMTMIYRCEPTTDTTIVRGHVAFVDDAGRVVMEIEELDSIASAALNRLGGTARTAEAAA